MEFTFKKREIDLMVGLLPSDRAQIRWTEATDWPLQDKACGQIEPRGGHKWIVYSIFFHSFRY